MMQSWLPLFEGVLLLVVVIGGGALTIKAWRIENGEDGERWRKRRMQGPFVPLSKEDIEEDEARRRQKKEQARGK